MAWQDRIQDASYQSPSNQIFEFEFEDVSVQLEKKTSEFDYPDADGSYVQDKGIKGRRFPMRIYFSGADYDLTADSFMKALAEKGTGVLAHPKYGTVNVVPMGVISRSDKLTTGANQAEIEVSFLEVNDIIFPSSQSDGYSNVVEALNKFSNVLATEFNDFIDFETAEKRATFQSNYTKRIARMKTLLYVVAAADEETFDNFNNIYDSIDTSITDLISDPDLLSSQTTLLALSASYSSASIDDMFLAYKSFIDELLYDPKTLRVKSPSGVAKNLFRGDYLVIADMYCALCNAAINGDFDIRSDAIAKAVILYDLFYEIAYWVDENVRGLEIVDPGDSYLQILDTMAQTVGYLIFIAFSLKQERRIITTSEHTFIDLISELYGPSNVEENIDFFINSNELNGDEILEIPRGRTIRYYV